MAKKTSLFECQHCGEQATKWLGKCPNCGSWDSFIEVKSRTTRGFKTNFKSCKYNFKSKTN